MDRLVEKGVGPEFLLSEAPGYRSRENIVIASNVAARVLQAGTVLGALAIGAMSASASAVTSGTGGTPGNGVISAVSADTAAKPGAYRVVFIEPVNDLGTFQVFDPDGQLATPPTGTVGTAYNGTGGVNFSVADGSSNFVSGDAFSVTVGAPADGYRYDVHDPEATNGLQTAAAILYNTVSQAASETVDGVGIVRDAEIISNRLTWDDQDAGEKVAALAQLAKRGLIAR